MKLRRPGEPEQPQQPGPRRIPRKPQPQQCH